MSRKASKERAQTRSFSSPPALIRPDAASLDIDGENIEGFSGGVGSAAEGSDTFLNSGVKGSLRCEASRRGEPGLANTVLPVRIADVADDSQMFPAGLTTVDEVEDYELRVYIPTVTLEKTVSAPWTSTPFLQTGGVWNLRTGSTAARVFRHCR